MGSPASSRSPISHSGPSQVQHVTSIQLKLNVVVGVCNYVIFLANIYIYIYFVILVCMDSIVSTKWSFSKVREQNHQDNYFMINIACRSYANMIKWLHAAIFELPKMIWSYFVTYILCYVMYQTLPWGGGADCFDPKWTVDSSYSCNVHCFQIRWCICHSIWIGIKGSSHNRVNAAMNPVSIVAGSS